MSQFNTDRHNSQHGGQYIRSHWMYCIHRTGFGHENNDSPGKCCSFLNFTSPAMSKVVNHISMGNCFCAKLLVLNSVGYSYSPWHDCPSPVYPSLQVQIWEPSVLLQFELTSQTWLPSLHSLISKNKNELPKRCSTETNIRFLSFWGNSFFFYLLSLMQWLYLGMPVRPQCILPYKCSCESRQCWYNLQSRYKHGCHWGTHRYLVVQMI